MPAFQTCAGTRLGKKWNVGSDDFVFPATVAIVVRLICFALTVGVIIYLYFPCDGVTIPPLLYGSLFALVVLQVMVIVNEGIILSISSRGTIMNPKPRRGLATFLYIRIALFCVEVVELVIPTYASFSSVSGDLDCKELQMGPLIYAKVITVTLWVTLLVFGVGFLFYVDPLGCFTPGLLQELDFLDSMDDKDTGASKEVGQHFKFHRSHIGQKKILRRLSAVCCCLGLGGHRSRGTALEEISKCMHTLFSDVDMVPSDLLCGLILVNKDQKRKKEECGCESNCVCLGAGYRELTFESMPVSHIPKDYQHKKSVPFNFDNEDECKLFEDLTYYMHYCMGIYGWPLTVFMNPLCGFCSLASVTCCLCNFRCWTDTEHIIGDNCCMCGLGSLRVHTEGRNVEVVYVTYHNDFFQAPFSLCIDHDKRTVVISVRGTLSIKDALTDMTMSLGEISIEGCPYRATYVHRGMHKTAEWIMSTLDERSHLKQVFRKYHDYQLVVTGHSLGAGVASILAVLLKPAYPSLICYAYSPPGCIFSFPLAVWSREFITSVVVGNDFVPRLSFQALVYLKKQLMYLLDKCEKPKHQMLFQPRWCERFNNPLCCKARENPSVEVNDIKPAVAKTLNTNFKGAAAGFVWARKAASRWKKKVESRRKRRMVSISSWIEDVNKGQKITSFPPGNMVYIDVVQNAKPCFLGKCFPNVMAVTHVSAEDMSIIQVDRGMVDDHMPHNVLGALHRAKDQLMGKGKHHKQAKTRHRHRQTWNPQSEDLAVLVEEDELNDLSMEQFEVVQSEPEEVQRSSDTESPELEEVFVDVHPEPEEKNDATHID